jgi:hypothetical protein
VYLLAASGAHSTTVLSGTTTYTSVLVEELTTEGVLKEGIQASQLSTRVAARLNRIGGSLSAGGFILRSHPMDYRGIRLARHRRSGSRVNRVATTATHMRGPSYSVAQGNLGQDIDTSASVETQRQSQNMTDVGRPGSRDSPLRTPHVVDDSAVVTQDSISDKLVEDFDLLHSIWVDDLGWRSSQIDKAHEGSCHWIYDIPVFRDWAQGDSVSMFWIQGKAGSGKSTMMKWITQSQAFSAMLSESAHMRNSRIIFSQFWASGTPLQRSDEGLLRSILFQILQGQPSLVQVVKRMAPEQGAHWDIARLSSALELVLSPRPDGISLENPLVIFVDGLDEYDGRQLELVHMLRKLGRAHHANAPCVKLCVSSRPEPGLQFGLAACPTLRVEDHTSRAIANYATQAVAAIASGAAGLLVGPLSASLASASGGVFLLAFLGVEQMRQGVSRGETQESLQSTLMNMSPNLEALYDRMIFESGNAAKAAMMVQIVQASQLEIMSSSGTTIAPVLTTMDVHFALHGTPPTSIIRSGSIQDMSDVDERMIDRDVQRTLTKLMGGMLSVAESAGARQSNAGKRGRIISYSHLTVRNFIEQKEIYDKARRSIPDFDVNLALLGSIVIQLQCLKFSRSPSASYVEAYELGCWPMVERAMVYASRVRQGHRRLLLCFLDALDRTMTTQLEFWTSRSGSNRHWSSFLSPDNKDSNESRDTFLSLAIRCSVLHYIDDKLDNEPDVVRRKQGRPLLDYALLPSSNIAMAVQTINPDIVRSLLRHGAQLDDTFAGQSVEQRFFTHYRSARLGSASTNMTGKIDAFAQTLQIIQEHRQNGQERPRYTSIVLTTVATWLALGRIGLGI